MSTSETVTFFHTISDPILWTGTLVADMTIAMLTYRTRYVIYMRTLRRNNPTKAISRFHSTSTLDRRIHELSRELGAQQPSFSVRERDVKILTQPPEFLQLLLVGACLMKHRHTTVMMSTGNDTSCRTAHIPIFPLHRKWRKLAGKSKQFYSVLSLISIRIDRHFTFGLADKYVVDTTHHTWPTSHY